MNTAPSPSDLARAGFARTERAAGFLADAALKGLPAEAPTALGRTADPDEALLALLRLAEAARAAGQGRVLDRLLAEVTVPGSTGHRLIRLLGVSVALGDVLTRHPELLADLPSGPDALEVPADQVRQRLLRSVGADPEAEVPVATLDGRTARDGLRIAYHERLVHIALADVAADHPEELQPRVSLALSDLAGAALDAALAVARAAVDGHEHVRLAVIAMGKTGAQELNYISDVDVVYVVEPAEGGVAVTQEEAQDDGAGGTGGSGREGERRADDDPPELIGIGSALCRELARVCSDRTSEGSLWQVDPNLRPEGKDGPLVRSLASFRRYYTTWAHSWEFQALLKARAVAGDRALGEDFERLVKPWIWQASTRDGFVEDTQSMRRRVVAHIPRGEAERNLKLGPGGLRDVEFTVQLLQMVHGRTDDTLHVRGTLPALERLSAGGYISRDHLAELDAAYRLLRTVEHRLQLHRMRRTQVMPTAEKDLRRLARSVGQDPETFPRTIERTRRRVRQLHEEIFYRPLLVTASRLSDGEVRLSPEAAQSRLAAIGYRDPRRALAHIEALTDGVSRSAAIQRQLLPALLEWFAQGIDPDLALLSFRRLSETAGRFHWYLAMLRDSGVAAQRLARVLSSSRFVGEQLEQIPEAVRWLSDDRALQPLGRDALHDEFAAVIRRVWTVDEAQQVLRRTRRRELLRIALAHLTGVVDAPTVARGLTELAEAVVEGGLLVAYHQVARDREVVAEDAVTVEEVSREQMRRERTDPARALGVEMAVLALGSFGAGEMGYSSDADVQFVVADRGAGEATGEIGVALATVLQKILNAPSAGADMRLNSDLRPEGRQGLLARSLDGWRDYYRRDAQLWEKQALTRARVVSASPELAEEITAELDRHRYPSGGLAPAQRREIARMKARVESERLPRGADPTRHLKLGRGGMTDVEWVAQLLTLDHAHDHPALQRTTTLAVLEAASEEQLLGASAARELAEAWRLAWALRRALFLWKGKEGAVLPSDRGELRAVARLLDGDDGTAAELEERWLRLSRRARSHAEEILFPARPGA
ncbi:bifunctional [glutamine synthetase] adenylyltransferase/[glutamine synthetase]-adenylyl-L-tyrosine phosphorylase [Brachybacterium sp. EF45031]|uniref:bifunctional [glutamine synthetase] adenylyltransferase/[glutamine synthetase]-adenylyl-L-tyrosine phosphorylase n=1 Tax=Brachybacterium sillae TaxID=2810536 RepID=UPI00217D1170|nr:bifunctional [glutamine synthetase] adenylyltransferase/[glutamine synthetase]-adenylyl-L-tyrosine phosphorylase [Brachybacterium sillae]MCS6710722.1 bifunctional [glutamine synthetase] adenylyltransferase/[glutamine synthetase]-adenylyl-L-tyrosine phosphorylase [Brachybacterium sillae]